MTLRSVEMQIALPRVTEAANVQNQLSQKPMFDQSALAQQEALKSKEQLKRSNQIDKTSTLMVGEDDARREGSAKNRHPGTGKRRPVSDRQTDAPAHPYKGRHIDLTL